MSSLLIRGLRITSIRPVAGTLARGSVCRPLASRSLSQLRVSFCSRPTVSQLVFKTATRFSSTAARSSASKKVLLGSSAEGLTPAEVDLAKELNWEEFLTLRKTQRRFSLVSSVFGAFLTTGITWTYISNIQVNPMDTIFGMDPSIVYIGGMMCSGVVGYLLGPPILGDTLFKMTHRSVLKAYNIRQKLFLQHVKKMRVDASRQSMANPVPDYYGEKIGSLKDYRQWLRDCNEYRRKASEFL